MRTVQSLGDDILGEVWLARNAGWLDGVGCERGGDDALAALVEADAHDADERDAEPKQCGFVRRHVLELCCFWEMKALLRKD